MGIPLRERTLTTADGVSLFLRCAELEEARADVVLVHGMGEHSARYIHVAESLAKNGYRFCGFDMRGHGRSTGRRGYINSYDDLIDDLALVWGDFRTESSRPVFLYGHSLGAQVVINFILDRQPELEGVVLASPWLQLAFAPKPWKIWLARLTSKVWPSFSQQTEINPLRLSRDQPFLQSMPDMHLVHHRMSTRMFFELMRGAGNAEAHAADFTAPFLMLHGMADPITSAAASELFYQSAGSSDKTLHILPDTLHETHNDLNRRDVLAQIVQWLDSHQPA